jgi:hypothetical protein
MTCACLPGCVRSLSAHQVVPHVESCTQCSQCFLTYSEHVVKNSYQVQQYLNEYSALSSVHRFPPAALRGLNQNVQNMHNSTTAERAQKALLHLEQAAKLARAKWTQFNIPLALLGLLVMFCCVAITLAAACVFLVVHRGLCAVASLQTESCTLHGQKEIVFPILTRYEGAAIGVVLLRAAVPFSNSLVLAESQVTQLFLSMSALIVATMVYAQIREMQMFQSTASTAVPCMSPYVAASGAWFLLSHAWDLKCGECCSGWQLNRNPPCRVLFHHRLFFCSLPDFSMLLNLLTATRMSVTIAAAAGVYVLLMPVCSHVLASLLVLDRQTMKAVTAFTSLLVLLFYALSKPAQQSHANLRHKPLRLASIDFSRVVFFASLMLACGNRLVSIGGIDRVGLSPFDKADQLHPHVPAAGVDAARSEDDMSVLSPATTMLGWHTAPTGHMQGFLWYQWVHPVPALLCLAVVLHVVKVVPSSIVYRSDASEDFMPVRWFMSEVMVLGLRLLACCGFLCDAQVRTASLNL